MTKARELLEKINSVGKQGNPKVNERISGSGVLRDAAQNLEELGNIEASNLDKAVDTVSSITDAVSVIVSNLGDELEENIDPQDVDDETMAELERIISVLREQFDGSIRQIDNFVSSKF